MPVTILKGSEHETYNVVISKEEYDSLLRTIDALSDPDFIRQIVQGEKELKEGKFKTLDQWAKERGLA